MNETQREQGLARLGMLLKTLLLLGVIVPFTGCIHVHKDEVKEKPVAVYSTPP